MSVQEIADQADMIVAGYAFKVLEDHIEITDLNNLSKTAVIQNDELVEAERGFAAISLFTRHLIACFFIAQLTINTT